MSLDRFKAWMREEVVNREPAYPMEGLIVGKHPRWHRWVAIVIVLGVFVVCYMWF
jgi:hypothetical protein